MLDLRRRQECVWDAALRPIGEGDFEKEPFVAWWECHHTRLANLHPQIAEQWIYRHWAHSYMNFLPLESLKWRSERWTTDQILGDIHLEFGGPMDADHDYRAFNGFNGRNPVPTVRDFDGGTWAMPILALETPQGIRSLDGDLPNTRFVIAEGSKRMRYLNALHVRGEAADRHFIFVLSCSEVR